MDQKIPLPIEGRKRGASPPVLQTTGSLREFPQYTELSQEWRKK
jgi:hypothetical protein